MIQLTEHKINVIILEDISNEQFEFVIFFFLSEFLLQTLFSCLDVLLNFIL